MIATYLVPTIEKDIQVVNESFKSREPLFLEEAKSCPGWKQSWAHIPKGTLVPYTLLTVRADSFAPLDAMPEAILIGKFDKLGDWLEGDKVRRAIPSGIRGKMTALGLVSSGTLTRRELWERIAHRLEPALHDMSYESSVGLPPSSITDDFNRANGAPGSGWTEVFLIDGGGSAAIVSNQFAATNDYSTSIWRRTEAAFPDDQYVQTSSRMSDIYSLVLPYARCSADGDGYAPWGWSTTGMEIRRFDATTTASNPANTYLTGFAGVWVVGTFYTLKITVTGDSIRVDQGIYNGTGTDSTYTSGKPGIYSYASDPVAGAADNFECTDATASSLIKTKKGLAIVSDKVHKGLAIASLKTDKGLANV